MHSLLNQFYPEENAAVPATAGEVHLGFVAGIIPYQRILPFEKVSTI